MLNYTPSQLEAINTRDQNLQIIACAGSGKTQVISQRLVNILNCEKHVTPVNIIAFTYTDKAAAELRLRILKLCREQIGQVRGLAEMYIGTIHAWCLKILQDYIYEFQKFSVLDDIKLKLFVDRYYNEIGMTDLSMERYKETGYFISLMGIIREAELAPGKVYPQPLTDAKTKYEQTLKKYCYFDFTMIMTEVVNHLTSDDTFRKKIASDLKYLIVDEYQDVNPIQEKIIEELVSLGANICVVGDDDQTIYQWRGGDVRFIQNFKDKYKNVRYIRLEDNFRSTPGIVTTALKTIIHNHQRLPKIMNAAGHLKYERGDILYNQYDSVEEENRFISDTVRHLRGVEFRDKENSEIRGLDYADFAVLLRTWKKAKPIMEAFTAANIPFIVAGVNELFQRAEIKAARAIFEYLKGEIEPAVLKAYWQAVSPGISDNCLNSAIRFLDREHKLSDKSFYGAFSLQQVFWDFLEKADVREETFHNPSLPEIIGNSVEEVVFYNLGKFSRMIDDYETINFRLKPSYRIQDFLNFMRYAAEDYYPEGWLNNTYKTPNAVQIMTIYQSKGLEFPVVFIPGLNKNYLPIKKHSGKSIWHYLDKSLIKDQHRYEGTVEDERRLLYVAITRSEKFLFFSRAPEFSETTGKLNKLYQYESVFCKEFSHSDYVFSSKQRDFSERVKTAPFPKKESQHILLNFSVLKAYFDCQYRFKLISLYGFVQPIVLGMGYGRSVHNVLMEIHRSLLDNVDIGQIHLPDLLDRHVHLPYATDELKKKSWQKIQQLTGQYLKLNSDSFKDIVFAEKEIQLDLGDGIMVNGRMDLIRKKNLDGTITTTIVDFKSREDAQTRDISMEQLSLYALGYQELSGEKADFLEIYNLDEEMPHPDRKELLNERLDSTRHLIIRSANNIRANRFDKCRDKNMCEVCYYMKLCSGSDGR